MAALLPHETLRIDETNTGVVLVDGNSSQGTENRRKILERALLGRATALQAEALLGMTRDESRALFHEHEVVYIYQNRIDAMGDKRDTEEKVFEAVETALDELILIIKKLTAANVTNVLVTADHGFSIKRGSWPRATLPAPRPAAHRSSTTIAGLSWARG